MIEELIEWSKNWSNDRGIDQMIEKLLKWSKKNSRESATTIELKLIAFSELNHITPHEYAAARPFIDQIKTNVIKIHFSFISGRDSKLEKQERSFWCLSESKTTARLHTWKKSEKKATKTAKKNKTRVEYMQDDENSLSLEADGGALAKKKIIKLELLLCCLLV